MVQEKKYTEYYFFHWHQADCTVALTTGLELRKNLNLTFSYYCSWNRQEEIWVQALKFSVYQGNGINTVFIFKNTNHPRPIESNSNSFSDNDNSSVIDSWLHLLLQNHSSSWHNVLLSPLFLGVPKEGPRCARQSVHSSQEPSYLCLHIRALEVPSPGLWWWREKCSLLCHETPAQMSLKTVTLCSPPFCWF